LCWRQLKHLALTLLLHLCFVTLSILLRSRVFQSRVLQSRVFSVPVFIEKCTGYMRLRVYSRRPIGRPIYISSEFGNCIELDETWEMDDWSEKSEHLEFSAESLQWLRLRVLKIFVVILSNIPSRFELLITSSSPISIKFGSNT